VSWVRLLSARVLGLQSIRGRPDRGDGRSVVVVCQYLVSMDTAGIYLYIYEMDHGGLGVRGGLHLDEGHRPR